MNGHAGSVKAFASARHCVRAPRPPRLEHVPVYRAPKAQRHVEPRPCQRGTSASSTDRPRNAKAVAKQCFQSFRYASRSGADVGRPLSRGSKFPSFCRPFAAAMCAANRTHRGTRNGYDARLPSWLRRYSFGARLNLRCVNTGASMCSFIGEGEVRHSSLSYRLWISFSHCGAAVFAMSHFAGCRGLELLGAGWVCTLYETQIFEFERAAHARGFLRSLR